MSTALIRLAKAFRGKTSVTLRRSAPKSRTRYFTQRSSLSLSSTVNASRTSFSKWWLSIVSVPVAYGAFWASSSNDNTLEKVNEDIEKFVFSLQSGTEETTALAELVLRRINALPDSELERDTMYVLAAFSSAAKELAQADPHSAAAVSAVEQSYKLAERITKSKNQSADLKLDALRCAHKAEYFLYMYRRDLNRMKEVLQKDAALLHEHYKTPMHPDESQAIWMLAAVLGNLDDSKGTQEKLEESLTIFKGATQETLIKHPELEKIWIERIVSTLSHSFVLEIAGHADTSAQFKRIALALYERYVAIAPPGSSIPPWKDLETRLKASALAAGPQ